MTKPLPTPDEGAADLAAELADRIAFADREGIRRIRRGWCPSCSKMVAEIVAFGAQQWLVAPGGRQGTEALWRRTIEQTFNEMKAAMSSKPTAQELFDLTVLEWLLERPAGELGPLKMGPVVHRLAPGQYEMPCRGCRHPRTVTITETGDIAVA